MNTNTNKNLGPIPSSHSVETTPGEIDFALQLLESILPSSAPSRNTGGIATRTSAVALRTAAELADHHGFTEYDADRARKHADRIDRVMPTVLRLEALAASLRGRLHSEGLPVAEQTYALYSTLKPLARVRRDPVLLRDVKQLGTMLYVGGRKRGKKETPPVAPKA